MTNNNIFKKSKSRLFSILLLCLVCIFSFSTAIACSEEDNTPAYDPSFEYMEYLSKTEAESLIKNPNFTQGLVEVKDKEYPVSSMTGWTISTDTGASSSAISSGVIDVSKFDNVITKLAEDTDFDDYLKALGATIGTNPSTQDIVTAGKATLANPQKRPDSNDNNVLMLNNVSSSSKVDKYGTAQYALSASEITLEAGEQACISVWVKTDVKLTSINADFGANIRLLSTVNGVTQAQFAVKNIIAEDWTEYKVYVKGNQYLSSTVTVALGLGFGDKSGDSAQYAYGTVYFDDLAIVKASGQEIIDKGIDFATNKGSSTYVKTFSQSIETYAGNPDANRLEATASNNKYFYDLSYNLRGDSIVGNSGIFNQVITTVSSYDSFNAEVKDEYKGEMTKPNVGNQWQINVNKSAYGAKIGPFTVAKEGFAVVSFKLKNNLDKYYKDGVKIYVEDIASGAKSQKSLLLTDSKNGEDETVYTITINNNFPDGATRSFNILIVVGPQNPAEQKTNALFPTGNVQITGPLAYVSDANVKETKADAYKFLESLSSGSYENFVSYNLYAGQSEDYSETADEVNYSIKVSGVNNHNITNAVVNPSEYKGVTPNHKLVKVPADSNEAETLDTQVNNHNNGVAGVINSQYLANYTNLPGINGLVDSTAGEDEHTQSLVIYNSTECSYGFVGATKTLSANSTVKVSLKIKTTATAYIYLTDMSSDNMLEALSLKVGEATKNLMLKINTEGEWKEISFNVASGASAINYRLEIWNGSRDGADTEAGYVIVEDITFGTFTEAGKITDIYGDNSNALADAYKNYIIDETTINAGLTHTRELTDLEKQFNEEYKDDSSVEQVRYDSKYVWIATEGTFVYAIYNTIDPVTSDPYENIETEEETEEESGCTANFDAGTFWLQFSTIALAVLLLVAILLLVIRTLRRNHKKAVKVKSRYSVRSRNVTSKVENDTNNEVSEPVEETVDATEEDIEDETEYTYGEVLEDFGDDVVIDGETVEIETTEEPVEEVSEPIAETTEEPSNDAE